MMRLLFLFLWVYRVRGYSYFEVGHLISGIISSGRLFSDSRKDRWRKKFGPQTLTSKSDQASQSCEPWPTVSSPPTPDRKNHSFSNLEACPMLRHWRRHHLAGLVRRALFVPITSLIEECDGGFELLTTFRFHGICVCISGVSCITGVRSL